jgi:rhodanese-related sulfurtransferase
MKFFICITLFFLNIQSYNYEKVEIAFYKKLINIGYGIVDVRTPQEFDSGHINNAVNIDLNNASFVSKINLFDKKTPILIYCRSGNRSQKAGLIMDSLGFEKIFDLNGGFNVWKE